MLSSSMSEQFSELDNAESSDVTVAFTLWSLCLRSGSHTGDIGVTGLIVTLLLSLGCSLPLLTSSIA